MAGKESPNRWGKFMKMARVQGLPWLLSDAVTMLADALFTVHVLKTGEKVKTIHISHSLRTS